MFSRPLVPALCAIIIGILTGHNILTNVDLPVILFPLAIILCLGIFFVIPFKIRPFYLLAVFVLIGINSQTNKSTLSGSHRILDKDERVVIEGTIYGPPKVRVSVASLPLHGEKILLAKEVKKVKINLLVKIYGYKDGLKVGERIRFPARLKEFKNFNNPGRFDYQYKNGSFGIFNKIN